MFRVKIIDKETLPVYMRRYKFGDIIDIPNDRFKNFQDRGCFKPIVEFVKIESLKTCKLCGHKEKAFEEKIIKEY